MCGRDGGVQEALRRPKVESEVWQGQRLCSAVETCQNEGGDGAVAPRSTDLVGRSWKCVGDLS